MSGEDYISKVMSHLHNREHYEELDGDPTHPFSAEMSHFLEEMVSRHSIDKGTMQSLLPDETRAARFYSLPKMCKPGNPGRPIVSSCGAHTEVISQFVEFHLSRLVRKI